MAQGEGFKHITVTAPEEDDVVIVAGAVQVEEPEEKEEPVEREPEASGKCEIDEAPVKQPAQKRPDKKKDDYRETTLEDLESTPMPLAQRIVIVVAIVCIIGAVIYYFAFMG